MDILKFIWNKIKRIIIWIASFLFNHKKYVGIALVAILLFASGWFANWHFNPRVVEKPVNVEKQVQVPVEIPVAVKGDTEIRYVEKTSPSDSDVEIHQEPPQISMQYNDKLYRIDTLKDEEQKFDKGKLDIKQSSTATLDVTPIADREVSVALDEQSKQLNDEFHKDLKKEKRESVLNGFIVGAAVATAISIAK